MRKAKVSQQGTVTVSWKKVSGAGGYIVMRSEKKKSGFSRIAKLTSGSKKSYKDSKTNPGTTYYYKVRAFKKKNGKTVKSGFSKVVSAKIPKAVKAGSQEDFAEAVSQMNKKYSSNDDMSAASMDPFASARLIVKGKKADISFDSCDPVAVVQSKDKYYILQFATPAAARKAAKKIDAMASVIYVEPDTMQEVLGFSTGKPVSSVPSFSASSVDPDTADMYANVSSLSWGTTTVRSYSYASSLKSLSRSVTVAVVDSGVGYHPFINDRVLSGIDYVDGDNDPRNDGCAHGTHVTGIIVDNTPELNVKILPVRVLGNDGRGWMTDITNGIRYAVDHGAKVINLSLGGTHYGNYYEDAIAYASSKGVSVVVSAGNAGTDLSDTCPAHIPDAITVGATDSYDNIASFSNYGSAVDVSAPGVYIYSTVPDGYYQPMSGTSMAAPFVTATAAMFRLDYPTASVASIQRLVRNNVKDMGIAGWDQYYGAGRLFLPAKRTNHTYPATSVSLNRSSLSLTVGQQGQLTATVSPAYATNKTVSWSSSNSGIASVSGGTVTANKAGTAYIYVRTANGKQASCKVTVKSAAPEKPAPGKTVTLKKASLYLTGSALRPMATTLWKKGTYTVKATRGFVRFVAMSAGTYKFSFSNMKTVGVSGYDWNIGYVSFEDSNGYYLSSSRVRINGAQTNTAYLSTQDGKIVTYPNKDSWLPSRTALVKLKKGEVIYLAMNLENGGRLSTLTFKIA